MIRFSSLLFVILLLSGAVGSSAQVTHSGTGRQVSITAGGMASIFQPDFSNDNWTCGNTCNLPISQQVWTPYAGAGPKPLFGVGAYVDLKLTRWVQIEAEGRWLRWNQYEDLSQDNYLIGPKVPVYHFWRSNVYAKALGGFSKMNYGPGIGTGRYTDLAFGGGMDVKLTRRLSLRAADFEYHYWPKWENSTLSPYGASMGIGYKIF
ncbi:MAG: outer membrane beta-barrel protein [Terracidiphilus sp.]